MAGCPPLVEIPLRRAAGDPTLGEEITLGLEDEGEKTCALLMRP
jgi:hypothetical protein